MTITLEIKTAPVPHQSFRVGRNGIKYKPKKIKDYQEAIKSCLSGLIENMEGIS